MKLANHEAASALMSARYADRAGLSLVEISVVLVIMSLLTAAAVPRWANSLQSYRLSNAADRVVADLARAQLVAFRTSTSKTVSFNVALNQYTLAGVKPLERASGSYVVTLSDLPYKSSLVSVFGQNGVQTITFNAFGIPDKGGNIIVAAGNTQKTITVDANSGSAVVQ